MAQTDVKDKIHNLVKEYLKWASSVKFSTVSDVLIRQSVRSFTSIGANFTEAQHAISKKEFTQKMFIAKKEAAESLYWLEMLAEIVPTQKEILREMYSKTLEIVKILSAICKTAQQKI